MQRFGLGPAAHDCGRALWSLVHPLSYSSCFALRVLNKLLLVLRVSVQDFIILTLIPPDPETSPLRTHQHAVPVRIVTDAWEEDAEDQI